jgi:endonuclease/exonuclease/phosphatase family metal-dependent hydrolase
VVRFSTYNTLELFADGSAAGREHYRLVAESILALRTDVLAVQEIRAGDEATAGDRLRQLADDTGLECLAVTADGAKVPALGLGSRGFGVGLLWRPGIEPVPGSFQRRQRDLWHALAWLTLDTGGTRTRFAAYHAPPFGRKIRAEQNECVVAYLVRPAPRLPILAGADWNGECADRVLDPATGAWRRYEPRDPYDGVEWFEGMVHQCEWDYDERGHRRHRADLAAGEVLWAGGLHDAAAALGAPWQATAGHHPSDEYGAHGVHRRIDGIRVTAPVLPALRSHRVTDTALTRQASDHLPVTVEYAPAAISAAG